MCALGKTLVVALIRVGNTTIKFRLSPPALSMFTQHQSHGRFNQECLVCFESQIIDSTFLTFALFVPE
ncbi:unnamed protein product [Periconia digitata]|uniref:Uncharacterized protein n=1 Tax=Periconia digitata TaxID=1303443 RepID=A0A9W4XNV0_9PLEO|nr:unnamed protein product [Periconia digitata]